MLRLRDLREHERLLLGLEEGIGPQEEEEAAIRFYGGVLGLQQIPRPQLSPRGGVCFRRGIDDSGHRVSDSVPMEGFRRIYVRDPFGNRDELIEPEA